MPVLEQELWTAVPSPVMYIVTTNAYIDKAGKIVMGRGAAKQATEKIGSIAHEATEAVKSKLGYVVDALMPNYIYGFTTVRPPREEKAGFGIFQVKYHFKDQADIALIALSMKELKSAAHLFPHVHFRMNYPGIGNGNLERKMVEPLLADLPDNIVICYKEE